MSGPLPLRPGVAAGAQGEIARHVLEAGEAYGRNDTYAGQRINLEFVSANPTGPIHIGGVRWAAVGDSLGRLLEFSGGDVTREYYFNDHGAQIDRFARSLLASARGEAAPEDGYGGPNTPHTRPRIRGEHPGAAPSPPAAPGPPPGAPGWSRSCGWPSGGASGTPSSPSCPGRPPRTCSACSGRCGSPSTATACR